MKRLLSLILILIIAMPLMAETAIITGTVKDLKTGKVLPYANVSLKESKNDRVLTGAMTDENGYYRIINIVPGTYDVTVSYMGYESKTVSDIIATPGELRLASVMLKPEALSLGEVEVTAEKPAVTYKIDKRIVDAKQFLSAQGGTAIDILENVPSVDVDIEGNVSLRGSSDFTVMIDGRPSVLDAQDALEQIPASSIENMEIMTNPSAKHDAEGGAGIINVITKRDKRLGISGLATANLGVNNKYGAGLVLNYTGKKINAYINTSYRKRSRDGEWSQDRYLFFPDTIQRYFSEGLSTRSHSGYRATAGLDWFITKNNIVGFSVNYGQWGMSSDGVTDYLVQALDPLDYNTIYDENNYSNIRDNGRGGPYYSVNADYTHKFKSDEKQPKSSDNKNKADMMRNSTRAHQLKMSASYRTRNRNEYSNTHMLSVAGDTLEGRKSLEDGPANHIRAELEYSYPWGESNLLEVGYNGSINWHVDGNEVEILDLGTGNYIEQPEFGYETDYHRNIHSGYITYSGEFGLLGVQPGLRAEYLDQWINTTASDSTYTVYRLKIFPTIHASYELPGRVQLMASYTRRIRRPRGWQLEPFYTWSDAYNIRVGNPELVPQMIDSYDIGIQKSFGTNFISLDAFYKKTHDKIERTQTLYSESDDVILNTYENVGNDLSAGVELTSVFKKGKWLMINASGRLYYYAVEGQLYGQDFAESSTNYGGRLRGTLMFGQGTRLQLGLNYRSKSASAQGSKSGGLMTDLALRQDFLDDKLTATLQVRDIFGTGYMEFETITPSYETYTTYNRESPMLMLNLSFKINNYKNNKDTGQSGDLEIDVDEGSMF